ncbi:MAG: hypothetical protein IKI94_09420 [Ruminococcus sp.]|nr:hypothetical protein [Ruminococcus sp.]
MKLKRIEKLAMEGGDAVFYTSQEKNVFLKGRKFVISSALIVFENDENTVQAVFNGTEEFDATLNAKKAEIVFGCNCKKQLLKLNINNEKIKSIASFIALKFADNTKMYGVLIINICFNERPYQGILALQDETDYEATLKLLYKISNSSDNKQSEKVVKIDNNRTESVTKLPDSDAEEFIIYNEEGEEKV